MLRRPNDERNAFDEQVHAGSTKRSMRAEPHGTI